MKSLNYIARWVFAFCLLGCALAPLPSMAQRAFPAAWQRRAMPPRKGAHAGDWLRRYKDVPPKEQERALQNDPAFRRLPPFRQQQLRRQLQRFSSLSPEQQQRVLNRMETWEHLTPDQQRQTRRLFGQMQQLAPERRHAVSSEVRDLSEMSPEQRDRELNSDNFKKSFSPAEQDMIRDASRLPLAGGEQ